MDAKYLELVEQFPLLPIKNRDDHRAAKDMILCLTTHDGELSSVEVGYATVLHLLIKTYERSLVSGVFESVTGPDALAYLLYEHHITQAQTADIAGISKQNLNDFLKGRRGLPKDARLRLAKHFKLDARVFEEVIALSLLDNNAERKCRGENNGP